MIQKISMMLFIAIAGISCSNAQSKEFTKTALDTKLLSAEGKEVAFRDIVSKYRGKTVVMEIWASWCSDCVKAMPKVKELQKNHPEATYLFVSMDKAEDKWKAGIEKHELKGDHYWAADGMKGNFGKSIDLDWIPRYVVIDKSGKIALYRAIETDFDKIDSTLKNLK